MKASLRSVRIAPKKANLVAKMVRGMRAADAMHILERTNKKAARILEELLRSAMANASHNFKQDSQTLVIRSLIVNQAQAYHRGVPMARGRVRPMRKFLSHIELELGLPEDDEVERSSKSGRKSKSVTKDEQSTSQQPTIAVNNAGKSSSRHVSSRGSSSGKKRSS
jgi:large subunit ribosomal protein L22